MSSLNERAWKFADLMANRTEDLRIATHTVGGARVLDCGIAVPGGLAAGTGLAVACLAGLGDVRATAGDTDGIVGPHVQVATDHPVRACLASQYAGWQISVGKYFAMGSGPMRAHYGREPLFDQLPGRESATLAVGTLETRKLPTEEVVAQLTEKLNLPAK